MPRQPPNMAMAPIEARLASFAVPAVVGAGGRKKTLSWPLPPTHSIKPALLAAAGFYFTPQPNTPDCATCYFCHKTLGGWEDGDDALNEHNAHMPANEPPCAWVVLGLVERDRKTEEQTGRRLVRHVDSGALVSARKATYAGMWPHDAKPGFKGHSDVLVAAGFHFSPTVEAGSDMVTCALCQLGLDGWEADDDPVQQHRSRRPNCPYFDSAYRMTPIPSDSEWDALANMAPASSGPSRPSSSAATGAKKRVVSKSKRPAPIDDDDGEARPTTKRKVSKAVSQSEAIKQLMGPRPATPELHAAQQAAEAELAAAVEAVAPAPRRNTRQSRRPDPPSDVSAAAAAVEPRKTRSASVSVAPTEAPTTDTAAMDVDEPAFVADEADEPTAVVAPAPVVKAAKAKGKQPARKKKAAAPKASKVTAEPEPESVTESDAPMAVEETAVPEPVVEEPAKPVRAKRQPAAKTTKRAPTPQPEAVVEPEPVKAATPTPPPAPVEPEPEPEEEVAQPVSPAPGGDIAMRLLATAAGRMQNLRGPQPVSVLSMWEQLLDEGLARLRAEGELKFARFERHAAEGKAEFLNEIANGGPSAR